MTNEPFKPNPYAHVPRDLGNARGMRNSFNSFALIVLIVTFVLACYSLYKDFSKLGLVIAIAIAVAAFCIFVARRIQMNDVRKYRAKKEEMNRKLAQQA